MLKHIPLEAELAIMCDDGAIEDYTSKAFEAAVEEVLHLLPDGVSEVPGSHHSSKEGFL